jgi:hypothetical protein
LSNAGIISHCRAVVSIVNDLLSIQHTFDTIDIYTVTTSFGV